MSEKVSRIMQLLDEIAPFELAEEWDNVGLLAGNPDSEVDTVLCALDLNRDVLDEAVRCGVQLIVTHHPILFRGRKNLAETDAEGKLLCALVRSGIAMIAMHTNYDNADPGVNDALARTLGLRDVQALENGMRLGVPAQDALKRFAENARQALGGPVRVYGDGERKLRTVAVLGGAGEDFIPQAIEAGADAFLTGEAAYHKALAAVDEGMCVLEAGHAATERPAIAALAGSLQIKADALEYTVRVLESEVRSFF